MDRTDKKNRFLFSGISWAKGYRQKFEDQSPNQKDFWWQHHIDVSYGNPQLGSWSVGPRSCLELGRERVWERERGDRETYSWLVSGGLSPNWLLRSVTILNQSTSNCWTDTFYFEDSWYHKNIKNSFKLLSMSDYTVPPLSFKKCPIIQTSIFQHIFPNEICAVLKGGGVVTGWSFIWVPNICVPVLFLIHHCFSFRCHWVGCALC